MKSEFDQMHDIWKKIISFGPRPMGSSALKKCGFFLEEEMEKTADRAFTECWDIQAWSTGGWTLEIEGFEGTKSYLFLGSGPSEEFEGTLRYLGKNRLWNMYSWDRYAVAGRDGETEAYVTVRGNGEAIPQMLFTGRTEHPHFLVGQEDGERMKEAESRKMSVRGFAKVEWKPAQCRNVVGLLESNQKNQKEEKIVICAHYDTVYNTAGAYDNASGVAVVLELGRRLKKYSRNCTIELLLTDGEEYDLTGARYRAEKCRDEKISMVLCIDGVGRERIMEVWSGPEPLERKIRASLDKSKEYFTPVYICPPPPGSDQEAYYSMGIPSCMLTFNDQGILHSPKDIYEKDKLDNMKVMVRITEDLLENLGIIHKNEWQ
ncbi:M28 family peptidase [Clostridium sp. AM58-1XD]|uniref:M28 family metallopeptidase n=1 Tax=Clostridium sp. AM58-1XD TaxID=2292307 RepID=UPI000E501159|nr:M28 family peptidase [Clostridium sp. AM58-1XD]RGZ00893.1 Zn-dependent exopeptidase M28 [Clostridium sp. AM58-1XD]